MATPTAPIVVIRGPVGSAQASTLSQRVRVALANGTSDRVVCDVGALERPDLGTVDALARVALLARRLGGRVDIRHAAPELRELLALAGLGDIVPCERSGVEVRGQTEHREEARGVEEERDPADPTP